MREVFLIVHFLGVAMGLGVSFAHMFLGIGRSKLSPEEAQKNAAQSMVLSIMGDIGITLLIISGLFLMGPFWSSLFSLPLLTAKLSTVIALIIVLVIVRIHSKRVVRENGGPSAKKLESLGKVILILGITIVIMAVLMFR